jgi:hypothetical protein
MPCPFFEPQQRAAKPAYAHARMPLIDEYDGLCHARAQVEQAPENVRFRCCNHGYSRTECTRFPQTESSSALRYSVVRETGELLQVLCIEERDHVPTPRFTIEFNIGDCSLAACDLTLVMQAQALAFCRSYVDRFLRRS